MSSNVLYGIQLHPCGQICYFSAGSWPDLTVGAKIVVRIDRGEAMGQVVKILPGNPDCDDCTGCADCNKTDNSPIVLSESAENTQAEAQSPNSSPQHPSFSSCPGCHHSPGLPDSSSSHTGPNACEPDPCEPTSHEQAESNSQSCANSAKVHSNCSCSHANASLQPSSEILNQKIAPLATHSPIPHSPTTAEPKKTVFAGELYQWDNWDDENGQGEDQEDDDSEPTLCLDPLAKNIPPILRPATEHDLAQAEKNAAAGLAARRFCAGRSRQHRLDMKLVMADYLLDGSKIIFYFTAPNRIDFRELVKDLVKEFRTRIELRQIGVRHETQMIGATGNCGMVCCCRRYMRKFAPVTIKMAKEQNLFLNPTKISGTCGRLLCCLAFEQQGYEEFHSLCPKMGKKYNTNRGSVKVLRSSIFRNSLTLLPEEGDEYEVSLDEWQEMEASRQGQTQNLPQDPNKQDKKQDRPERAENFDKNSQNGKPGEQDEANRSEIPGKTGTSDRQAEQFKNEGDGRAQRFNRPSRPNPTVRPDSIARPNQLDRPERANLKDSIEQANRPKPAERERPDREKTDRADRNARPAHGDKQERNRQYNNKGPSSYDKASSKSNFPETPETTETREISAGANNSFSTNQPANKPRSNTVPQPELLESSKRNEPNNIQVAAKEPAQPVQNAGLSRFLATTAGDDENE